MKAESRKRKAEVTRNAASGVTLLEVLIAMLVMVVGVLSVAALLPLGAIQTAKGTQSDRAAACGQAALRDFKVRGMGNTKYWAGAAAVPVCIDPWGTATPAREAGALGGITRINLTITPTRALADEIFICKDNLLLDPPPDNETRPSQHYIGGPAVATSIKRDTEGLYSWLAMLSPAEGVDGMARLAIVVYLSREPGSATSASGTMIGGYGGGTITGMSATNVFPGSWLMVRSTSKGTVEWYRVVGIGTAAGSTTVTSVTVVGGDWDTVNSAAVSVTICPGVVGVYEKTVRLEGPSLWSVSEPAIPGGRLVGIRPSAENDNLLSYAVDVPSSLRTRVRFESILNGSGH